MHVTATRAAQLTRAERSSVFTRLSAGDATAGADLVRLWGDQLYRTALAVVRSRDLAEDVVQDTLVKAITRAGGFRGRSDPGTWLHRICVNTAYDALRRERRRATFQGIGREPECPAGHGYPTGLDERPRPFPAWLPGPRPTARRPLATGPAYRVTCLPTRFGR